VITLIFYAIAITITDGFKYALLTMTSY